MVIDRFVYLNKLGCLSIGARPAPRTWSKWNMHDLEPANIKMREELLKQAQERKFKGNCVYI